MTLKELLRRLSMYKDTGDVTHHVRIEDSSLIITQVKDTDEIEVEVTT